MTSQGGKLVGLFTVFGFLAAAVLSFGKLVGLFTVFGFLAAAVLSFAD